jgi:hypothetical protein
MTTRTEAALSRAVRTLIVAAALVAGSAAQAHAATPFTAGTGAKPSVAVGSDSSGHVVWDTSEDNDRVGYCRVAPGATSCNRTDTLNFGAATDAQTTGRPVVFTPAPNKVVIVAGCWDCGPVTLTDRTYRWISTNNGESFGPATEIGRSMTTNGTGLWLDDAGIFAGVTSGRAKAADLTAGQGVEYASGGAVYSPQIVRVPGANKLVAATNDLDVVKFGVFKGPTFTVPNVNNVGNWDIDQTLPAAEGDNSETALNSGPNGVYLTYRYFVPNDNRVGLRRFDSATNTFGAATHIEGADPIDNNSLDYPDSYQDASGRIHVLWRTLHGGGRLRYRVSDTTGANFTPAANLATQEGFYEPEIAAGGDGRGFAVWTPSTTGNVRVVPLDPQPEPATPPPPGGGSTPPPTGGSGSGSGSGPTIRPTFSFTGPGSVLSARIVGSRIKVRMKGAIGLPAGANPATACTGKVRLKLKKRKRTMLNRTVRVKMRRGKCRFAKTVFLKRSKVGKTRRLRLKVRFMGNTVLKAGSRNFTLTIRK